MKTKRPGASKALRGPAVRRPLWVSFGVLVSCQLFRGEDERSEETGSSAQPDLQSAPASPSDSTPKETGPPVAYEVSFPARKNHYAHVDVELPTGGEPEIELMLPVWTPGSYLVREYAGQLEAMTALSPPGQSITKTDKNHWRVSTGGANRVRIGYDLYCAERTVRANWVDGELAIVVGAATFVSKVGSEGSAHDVRLKLPASWSESTTGLRPHPDGGDHHYRAESFDELVDSPLIAGNPKIYSFSIEGVPHRLANFGQTAVWDGQASAWAAERIAREVIAFWGLVPYESYTFLNVIGEGRGGLEHLDSTLMMTNRWAQGTREGFTGWMGLVSHEFFHTWNVKRMRPAPLGPFDYNREAYTPSLWIAEGLTSYYDDLLLARAGLISRKEYLGRLSKSIERHQSKPGRAVQTLQMASHDAWIKFYRGNENSSNSTISYYTKGSLVGLLLDARIRRLTSGNKNLDDAMRLAYQRFSGEVGYTPQQFQATVEEVAGVELDDFFGAYVRGVSELDYSEALSLYGLQMGKEGAQSEESAPGDRAKAPRPKPSPKKATSTVDAGAVGKLPATDDQARPPPDPDEGYLGVTTRTTEGRLLVGTVLRGGPAWRAGVLPGDELIALDGYRLEDATSLLAHFPPERSVSLLLARQGIVKTIPLILGAKPEAPFALRFADTATAAQRSARNAWLGTAPLSTYSARSGSEQAEGR